MSFGHNTINFRSERTFSTPSWTVKARAILERISLNPCPYSLPPQNKIDHFHVHFVHLFIFFSWFLEFGYGVVTVEEAVENFVQQVTGFELEHTRSELKEFLAQSPFPWAIVVRETNLIYRGEKETHDWLQSVCFMLGG